MRIAHCFKGKKEVIIPDTDLLLLVTATTMPRKPADATCTPEIVDSSVTVCIEQNLK